jgi:hypothetical protein
MASEAAKEYQQSYEIVFGAAQQALADCGFQIKYSDFYRGWITASAMMGVVSAGEELEVYISRTETGVRVHMRSKAAFLTDFGKSKKNVDRFFLALDDRIEKFVPVTSAQDYYRRRQ